MVTTGEDLGDLALGGAIASIAGKLTVFDTIFKNNRAIQVSPATRGGGAIYASSEDALVLSSVFELNEASNIGGAAQFRNGASVNWYNNKELLFGNDAGVGCDGVSVDGACDSVGDNFSF